MELFLVLSTIIVSMSAIVATVFFCTKTIRELAELLDASRESLERKLMAKSLDEFVASEPALEEEEEEEEPIEVPLENLDHADRQRALNDLHG